MVRSMTAVRMSMRLAPDKDADEALKEFCRILTSSAPHDCKVTLKNQSCGGGYCMKDFEPKFSKIIQEAGLAHFDQPTGLYGEGGAIPFLGVLSRMYPKT